MNRSISLSRLWSGFWLILVLGSAGSHVCADDEHFGWQELRAKFLAAQPGLEKGMAIYSLFEHASPAEVQLACFDEDDSIALYAAWRRLETQMAGRFNGPDRAANVVPIPAEISREFMGFVEGRLRVSVPDAWMQNLLAAQYWRLGSPIFFSFENGISPHDRIMGNKGELSGRARTAMPEVDLIIHVEGADPYARFSGGSIQEGKDANVNLPDEFVTLLKEHGKLSVTGIATDDRAFIALPWAGEHDNELVCLKYTPSKAAAKVVWQLQMDSSWDVTYNPRHWFTEFRLKDKCVYLFHCSDSSIGIECLSIEDGTRIFSFNSRLP